MTRPKNKGKFFTLAIKLNCNIYTAKYDMHCYLTKGTSFSISLLLLLNCTHK